MLWHAQERYQRPLSPSYLMLEQWPLSGMPLTEEQIHEVTVSLHAQVHEAREVEQLVNKMQSSIPRPAPQVTIVSIKLAG